MRTLPPKRISVLALVFLTFAGAASAQVVYGDKGSKKYFPINCEAEVAAIPDGRMVGFKTPAAAETAGYARDGKCSKIERKAAPIENPPSDARPAPVKNPSHRKLQAIRLAKLIELTTEPGDFLDKILSVRASVSLTTYEKYDDDHYTFLLDDGSDRLYVYMRKDQSQSLRNLLLSGSGDAVGTFTFIIDREILGYLKKLNGRLLNFRVSGNR